MPPMPPLLLLLLLLLPLLLLTPPGGMQLPMEQTVPAFSAQSEKTRHSKHCCFWVSQTGVGTAQSVLEMQSSPPSLPPAPAVPPASRWRASGHPAAEAQSAVRTLSKTRVR